MSKKRSKKQQDETSETKVNSDKTKEYQALVIRICDRFFDIITEELNHLTPKLRWLIYSRIINYLFQRHYGVSMDWAHETVKSNEEDTTAEEEIRPQPK